MGQVLVLIAAIAAAGDVNLHVRVIDEEKNSSVPARIYLQQDERAILPKGFSVYSRGLERHFLVTGEFSVRLAPGTYRIRAERGLEYLPAEKILRLQEDSSISLILKRWIDLNAEGWFSADMHVHRDPSEMETILMAEGLNFAPTITQHVWGSDVRNPWPSVSEFPVVVDGSRFYTANSQEIERIEGGPGAIILYGPRLPLPYDGYEFFPPSVGYSKEAHSRGSYVGGDKFFWLDNVVNVALGEIDFIELNCNHFLPWDVDTDLAHWSSWRQELRYLGDQGLADWLMNFYYHFLNSGFQLPLSAGSASGVKATPVGYNRVYVRAESPTYDNFMEALIQGRSFTTNGPVLELTINGHHGIGSVVPLSAGEEVHIRAVVRSRRPIERAEIIANGKVIAAYPVSGRRSIEFDRSIRVTESMWLALRAFEDSDRTLVFGHTSPVYLIVNEKPVHVRHSARYLLEKVDRLIEYTQEADGFREETHRQKTIDLYQRARTVYENVLIGGDSRP